MFTKLWLRTDRLTDEKTDRQKWTKLFGRGIKNQTGSLTDQIQQRQLSINIMLSIKIGDTEAIRHKLHCEVAFYSENHFPELWYMFSQNVLEVGFYFKDSKHSMFSSVSCVRIFSKDWGSIHFRFPDFFHTNPFKSQNALTFPKPRKKYFQNVFSYPWQPCKHTAKTFTIYIKYSLK